MTTLASILSVGLVGLAPVDEPGWLDKIACMDRSEAVELLSGGVAGIKAWNRRRRTGEKIPSLDGANLRRWWHGQAQRRHVPLDYAKHSHAPGSGVAPTPNRRPIEDTSA